MLIFRLGIVLTCLALQSGCKTSSNTRFASLFKESSRTATNANGVVESSADGYIYTFKTHDPKQSPAITYNKHIFSVSALEAYSSGTHPFAQMKPQEFTQRVEQHALELGKKPALELAEHVDQALDQPSSEASVDEHLFWLAREKLVANTDVSDRRGLLFQKQDDHYLIITQRMSINPGTCSIRAHIIDDQSRPLLSARLNLPNGTTVDDAILRDATQLMWDTLDV